MRASFRLQIAPNRVLANAHDKAKSLDMSRDSQRERQNVRLTQLEKNKGMKIKRSIFDPEDYVVATLNLRRRKLKDGLTKMATHDGFTLWAKVISGLALCWRVTDRSGSLVETITFYKPFPGGNPSPTPTGPPRAPDTCPGGPRGKDGGTDGGTTCGYVCTANSDGGYTCWKECH
ncbi:MAG: hypothetical protein QOF48_3257 [Verrucomicrobiota bacterium]|jgi:hypothetical protein